MEERCWFLIFGLVIFLFCKGAYTAMPSRDYLFRITLTTMHYHCRGAMDNKGALSFGVDVVY